MGRRWISLCKQCQHSLFFFSPELFPTEMIIVASHAAIIVCRRFKNDSEYAVIAVLRLILLAFFSLFHCLLCMPLTIWMRSRVMTVVESESSILVSTVHRRDTGQWYKLKNLFSGWCLPVFRCRLSWRPACWSLLNMVCCRLVLVVCKNASNIVFFFNRPLRNDPGPRVTRSRAEYSAAFRPNSLPNESFLVGPHGRLNGLF